MLLPTLLRVSLAAVLLLVSMLVPQGGRMMLPWVLVVLFGGYQAAPDCKNCMALGKEEKAMFRAHSEACLAQSAVQPQSVLALLRGELRDEPALRKHVYCVLLKCKLVGKDGKLHKAAVRAKLTPRDGNATKVLESCAEAEGETPEDRAWNLFRCGYDKKAVLFHHMPAGPIAHNDTL